MQSDTRKQRIIKRVKELNQDDSIEDVLVIYDGTVERIYIKHKDKHTYTVAD